jgi:hypothetical protein
MYSLPSRINLSGDLVASISTPLMFCARKKLKLEPECITKNPADIAKSLHLFEGSQTRESRRDRPRQL